MKRIKLAFIVLVTLGLGLLAIPATQAVIEEEVTEPQNDQVTSQLQDPENLKQELKEPEYVQGELIVKLREGATLENLKELNEKYKVTAIQKVFKESSDPKKNLDELKDKLAKISTEHETWYWQLDKDSQEYKEYIQRIEKEKEELKARIKTQEELVAHLDQRQKRAPEGATAPDLKNTYLLKTEEKETNIPFIVAEYKAHPSVEYSHPNFLFEPDVIPNDPRFSEQYAHTKTQAPLAWEIRHDSPSVNVAVIGVGIDYNHPDLAANIWINQGEIAGNGIDDDVNGFIDDIRGWDFGLNDNDPMPSGNSHETSVTGVIGAVGNNSIGISGVSWQVKLMALKINYTATDVVNALNYAYNNGADVVNMSFGNYDITKYGPSSAVKDVVDAGVAQGVLLVATAGNESIKTERYPGAFEGVIGVAATEQSDQRAGFSNWGSWVDVAAPGAGILSTVIGSNYNTVSGTSFAAPYVAGLGALLIAQHPEFDLFTLRSVIEYTVDKIQTDRFIGSGRVNCFKAIQAQGIPSLFAIIKSPLNKTAISTNELVEIQGTALGVNFYLEYKISTDISWQLINQGASVINGTLGILNYSDLSNGIYQIRLTAIAANGQQDTDTITIFIDRSYQNGWPKIVSSSIIFSAVTTVDLDNDGKKEIIFGDNAGNVHIYKADGTPFTGWPKYAATGVFGAPAVGDINGDGEKEIVVGASGDQYASGIKIFAWKINGTLVKNWTLGKGVRGAVVLADLDKNGIDEVIAASQDGKVHTLTMQGELPGWPVTNSVGSNIQSAPAVGDLDNNGYLEVVVSSYADSKIYVWDHTGQLKIGWPQTGGIHFDSALGDLDGDGILEVVNAASNQVYVRCADGSLYLGWPQSVQLVGYGLNYSAASLADLDKDGYLEILVGGGESKKIYIWKANGQLLPGWPQEVDGKVSINPAVGDLDGDTNPDVVVGTEGGLVYAWNASGQLLNGFPRGTSAAIYRTPTISDLDGDGDVELMVGNENGILYIWDFSAPYKIGTMHWSSFRHDLKNTAKYIHPDSTGSTTPVIDDNGIYTASTTTLSATWSSDDPESGIIEFQYKIVKDSPSGIVIKDWTSAGLGTSIVVNDLVLEDGKTYYFAVKAINGARIPSAEGYSDGITVDVTPPQTIDSGIDSLWHNSPVTVTLIASDTISGVDKTYYSTDGSQPSLLYTAPFTLSTDGIYTIKYYSLDKAGNQEPVKTAANPVKIDTTMPITPIVIDGGTSTYSLNQLSASWTSDDPESSIAEYQYRILQDSTTGTVIKDWTPTGTTASVTATGLTLTIGKTYYFSVKAKNGADLWSEVGYSDGITVEVAIAAPSNLVATTVSSSQIKLTWQDNSDNETNFRIERRKSLTGSWSLVKNVGANVISFTNTGLTSNTTYYYRVRAYNTLDNSSYSNEALAKTLATPLVASPTNLTSQALSSSQIKLTWLDNSNNETGFEIRRSTTATGTYTKIASVGANITSYTHKNLTANTTYYYKVRAYNSLDNSYYSNLISATTLATPLVAAPTALAAQTLSSTQIKLTWKDNSTNETGFKIERRSSPTAAWSFVKNAGANVTSYTNTGLTINTTYYYRVRAYNSLDNSYYSNEALATTLAN